MGFLRKPGVASASILAPLQGVSAAPAPIPQPVEMPVRWADGWPGRGAGVWELGPHTRAPAGRP